MQADHPLRPLRGVSSETGNPEVLVARIVSGPASSSRWLEKIFFQSRFSTAASMTRSV